MVSEWRIIFAWPRCYRLEAVKIHKRDPSRRGRCKAVCPSRARDSSRCWPLFAYNGHKKRLGDEYWGGGRTLHRMAKIHLPLEMWQRSHNLCATQKESHAENKPMTAVGYISDTEDSFNVSWAVFQHDGAAAFELSERSPLQPHLSAKDLHRGQTHILMVRRLRGINCHPVNGDEDCIPESSLHTEDCLNWNADIFNPNVREDNFAADVDSVIEQDNSIMDLECPKQRDLCAAPNSPGLIWPTRKYKRQPEKVLMTVNAIETRSNMGVKKKLDRMRQWFTSFFMYLDREFELEIYYALMVSSSLWIPVDKQMYSWRNVAFGKIHKFSSHGSEWCKNVTATGFATGLSLIHLEGLPISSNDHEDYYR